MKKPEAKSDLPPDVTAADTKHPGYAEEDREKRIPYSELEAMGLSQNDLTFYRTEAFGWCLTTLLIGKGKGNQPDRYYGVTTDGKLVRVGRGPHVKAEVTVYLTRANLDRLKKYVELYNTGLELAGATRDRISSRRAQGQVNRAKGMTSWYW